MDITEFTSQLTFAHIMMQNLGPSLHSLCRKRQYVGLIACSHWDSNAAEVAESQRSRALTFTFHSGESVALYITNLCYQSVLLILDHFIGYLTGYFQPGLSRSRF